MATRIEQTSATNINPVLSVDKNGTVLISNEADNPLLNEWDAEVGEKLPHIIIDLVQKVISLNSPEKIEVKAGSREYLVVFSPLPEQECVNISGFDISNQKEVEEKVQEREVQKIADVELAEIIDAQAIQSLMDDFYRLVQIPMSLVDLRGSVLVGVGWQDICTKFHRINPETCNHCIESSTMLSEDVFHGEFKLYKCKNNMWHIATPIMVGGQRVGNIISGQFFFDDEPLDYEFFRSQARKYGFNEEEYIAALEKVPRLSRKDVDTGMSFFIKLANLISQLSYSNIKLVHSLVERDTLMEEIRKSDERFRSVLENSLDSAYRWDLQNNYFDFMSPVIEKITGFSVQEMTAISRNGLLDRIYPDDIPQVIARIAQSEDVGFGTHEYRFKCKDGKYRWLADHFSIIKDKNGLNLFRAGIARDITEQKLAEEALCKSEARYRMLYENLRDAFVQVSMDGRIIDFNIVFCQLLGYSPEELRDLTYKDLTPERWHSFEEKIVREQIIPRGYSDIYEKEYRRKDGTIFSVELRTILSYDDAGQPSTMWAIVLDITERKKVEEFLKKAHDTLEKKVKERTAELEQAFKSLEESEKGLAEAQEMAHIGNWEWDIATDKAYWSKEMYRIFKRDPQKLAPSLDEYLSYIHPDDLDYYCNETYITKRESTSGFDFRIVLADREERTLHIKSEFIFNDENIPIRVKGTVQDITERKRSEEKLRESEEKYRNIVETANEGILVINDNNIITYVNKKMSDMLGYTVEEGIGRPIWGFISEQCKADVKLHLEKRMRGLGESYELKLICKDGSSVWTYLNVKPLFDNDGRYIGAISMFTDITKRKEAEETLKNMEIIRKQEIHHRIKNNLQVISSLLDLQAEKLKNRKCIKDCQIECIRNSEVINAFKESQDRVISMALIHEELHKGGKLDTLNFPNYIEKLADNLLLTYSVGNNGIILDTDIEEEIYFDMETAVPLGIIINELVSNSLKHAFPDRDNGEIQIKLHKEECGECKSEDCNHAYVLSVSDNGIGIPEDLEIEDLDSLGLQLVTTLVDQLDGEIELKRNNGTEFIIRFHCNRE